MMNLPEAGLYVLGDYVSPTPYTDLAVERTAEIGAAMTNFLARMDQQQRTRPVALSEATGEIDGISYQVQGAGSPLVLLPLSVAPPNGSPAAPAHQTALHRHPERTGIGDDWQSGGTRAYRRLSRCGR
jgi:hypothetical protein